MDAVRAFSVRKCRIRGGTAYFTPSIRYWIEGVFAVTEKGSDRMLMSPMEILQAFPKRKTKAEIQAFRDAVQSYATALGYKTRLEQQWLIIGDTESANYLLVSGNGTFGILALLEILRLLPENRRSRVCFVLFKNVLLAGYSYCKAHPAASEQLVIHLEAAGEGDKLRIFPTKKLNDHRGKLTSLYKACGYFGKKSLLVQEKDLLPWYVPFPYAVSICTVPSGKKETYRNRIRSCETTREETNINILRAALTSFLCCDAAQ